MVWKRKSTPSFVTGVELYWIHCNAITFYVMLTCDIFFTFSPSFPYILYCFFLIANNWKICDRSLPRDEYNQCIAVAVKDAVVSLAGGKNCNFTSKTNISFNNKFQFWYLSDCVWFQFYLFSFSNFCLSINIRFILFFFFYWYKIFVTI